MLRVTLRIVIRRAFPGKPTRPLDGQQMVITLRRGDRDLAAQHRILAGRDEHAGSRGVAQDRSVHGRLVVHAIPDEAIDFPVDLGQQRWHL